MNDTRRKYWVDTFQTWLFYRIGAYWLIFTFTVFNLLLGWRLLQEGPGDFWQQLAGTAYDNIPLFVCFLVVTPWVALDAVRFSNRVVGPLYRFRKTIQSVTANETIKPIRLRQGDFLGEMQDDFNAMLEALEQRGAVQLVETQQVPTKVGG